MQLASATASEPEITTITPADRARLSAPALRTFRQIADQWQLSERERLAILGEPARSTYHQWMRKALAKEDVTLPLDTLVRLSAVFGIWKALEVVLPDRAQALTWLTGPHAGTLFQGAPPMDFITKGAQDGIMSVRRYLDAWLEGRAGQGASSGGIQPVAEDDLVFV